MNMTAALVDLDEAIRLEPTDGPAHVLRGAIWNSKGEFDKAISDTDQAMRLGGRAQTPLYIEV